MSCASEGRWCCKGAPEQAGSCAVGVQAVEREACRITPGSHCVPPAAEYAGYGMAGQVVYFDSAFGKPKRLAAVCVGSVCMTSSTRF